MDETTVKKCPQCGADVAKDNLFCAACGYKLREKTEKDLTDTEKEKRDEKEYIEAKKILSSSMNAISIIQTIVYYAIYAAVIVVALFGFRFIGKNTSFNLLQLLSHPTILVFIIAGYMLILTTIDCIGFHIGIKTVKEHNINAKRFVKVSLNNLAKMKPKKDMFSLVEFKGSALNIKTKTKEAIITDEARACRIVLAAATPELEKRFRVELLVKQLFLIAMSVAAVFLYPSLVGLFGGVGIFSYFLPLIATIAIIALSAIPSMIISLGRIKKQKEWFNAAESEEVSQETSTDSEEDDDGSVDLSKLFQD